jgi:hypothetical protein
MPMGFNQCYLPTIEKMIKEFERVGLEKFVSRYRKYDSLTGSSESMDYLEQKQKQWRKINLDGGPKVDQTDL